MSSDIARLLVCDGIPYFFLDECPSEFMGYGIQKAKCYKNKLLASIDDHSEYMVFLFIHYGFMTC